MASGSSVKKSVRRISRGSRRNTAAGRRSPRRR